MQVYIWVCGGYRWIYTQKFYIKSHRSDFVHLCAAILVQIITDFYRYSQITNDIYCRHSAERIVTDSAITPLPKQKHWLGAFSLHCFGKLVLFPLNKTKQKKRTHSASNIRNYIRTLTHVHIKTMDMPKQILKWKQKTY